MQINLFDLIEGFFSGVVYFFYNAVATIFELLRHPFRAPLRLYLKYRSKNQRQIGGLTFLFLVFFGLMLGIALSAFGNTTATETGMAIFVSGDFLAGGAIWPAALSALISTTVADAMLRLFLRAKLRNRPLRRAATLNAVEFSLLWPIVGIACVAAAWGPLELVYRQFGIWTSQRMPGSIAEVIAGIVLLLLTALPALALLRSALRRSGRRAGLRIAKPIALPMGAVAICLTTFVAFGAGAIPSGIRMAERMHADSEEVLGRFSFRMVGLRCRLSGPDPYADIAFQNVSRRPRFLHVRDLRITGSDWRHTGDRKFEFSPLEADPQPILVPAGAATSVRVRLRARADYVRTPEARCSLSAPADERGGGLFRTQRLGEVDSPG